jgi:hypothetical protein
MVDSAQCTYCRNKRVVLEIAITGNGQSSSSMKPCPVCQPDDNDKD